MFELIINILLVIFLGFTFFTHVLEAAVPIKVAKNPYVLQPDVWPKTIIILLEICLIINIIQIIRKNKGNTDFTLAAFAKSIPGFLKSKLFMGIVIMVAASFILDTVGFIVTSMFVLFFYGLLLGEKNVVRLLPCASRWCFTSCSAACSASTCRAVRSASCATSRCGLNPSSPQSRVSFKEATAL